MLATGSPQIASEQAPTPWARDAATGTLDPLRFELTNRVSHPASVVLETMIERMEAIAAFLARIVVSGDLRVRPESLPGVPGFLSRTLAPQIERFVVGMVSPNLGDLAAGLQRYFDSLR